MNDTAPSEAMYDIAIIGMSGRFPKANTIDEFWHLLRNGEEAITFFSEEELKASGVTPDQLQDPHYVRAKAVLEGADLFDAAFFGYSPIEAEMIDPQQRLLLECAWQALENAGYAARNYKGLIGVYAGSSLNTYTSTHISDLAEAERLQQIVGNNPDFLTTRISYKLNLRGMSVTVQTACSTSLVAVHMAAQSLLNRECDMALAGGVSVKFPQRVGYIYQKEGIHSPDGHCRAFDSQAEGTVSGEGIGLVALKRLEDAIQDRDTIYAVIKGSAVNNDGAVKIGYTAPAVQGQAEVIASAFAVADVRPGTVTYIEAHGTGTALGDPIEISALRQVFESDTSKKNFCALGSVKTNIGHLDAAAGIAGLIKTILALKQKRIPPSLHYKEPNPQIDFANSPFYVNTQLTSWQPTDMPRRACVSSFGMGGTNAHVLLEECPSAEIEPESRAWQLLLLSARTDSALQSMSANLLEYLRQSRRDSLADVAYTLQVGRQVFEHRQVIVCAHYDDAIHTLETGEAGRVFSAFQPYLDRPVTYMFPGQGTQYIGMAQELYQSEPLFRRYVDQCVEILKAHLQLDLRTILYPKREDAEQAQEQLRQTWLTQPALFVTEYALARLWMSWGILPAAMIGHSIGEYVAACLAGVFQLEDALALVSTRGRLMQQTPPGSMLAVALSADDVSPLLGETLALAAVNAPAQCVVSGSIAAIDKLAGQLDEKGVSYHRLTTSHAFHSQMMDHILDTFREQVRKIHLHHPQMRYISNVTGRWITAEEATNPDYWVRHLRQTVRFADGLVQLCDEQNMVLLEVGPRQTLSTLARLVVPEQSQQTVLSSLSTQRQAQSDLQSLLSALGQLWLLGARVDWESFYAHERRRRIPLPTYPFERKRYWKERTPARQITEATLNKKADINDWFYYPSWKRLPLSSPTNVHITPEHGQCWLLFSDTCGIGSDLGSRLEQMGHTVVQVVTGDHFQKRNDAVYSLNPRQPGDYDTLLRELHAAGRFPQKIAHMWTVTDQAMPDSSSATGHEWLEQSLRSGFHSLLFLAQALGRRDTTEEIHLWVISSDMQDVTGEEVLRPEKAIILGMCKVIPQEYEQIKCASIDIALPGKEHGQKRRQLDRLLSEFSIEMPRTNIAYRGDYRWIQTFEPSFVESQPASLPPLHLPNEGVYLITGGLGGIGLALADYLARNAERPKLILVGRSSFPHRTDWSTWLNHHNEHDKISQRIKKLQVLERAGAEILILRADVADQTQMQAVVNEAQARFGPIRGVIHSAGVPGGGSIQRKTLGEVEAVMTPKVRGTLVLHSLFKNAGLDFFVLCSSLASLLGGFGQADYSGANAFLNAFARQNAPLAKVVISINWDTWGDVGMAVNTEVAVDLKERRRENLDRGMSSQEGIDAFDRILRSRQPQVFLSAVDLHRRIEKSITREDILRDVERFQPYATLHARPQLENPYVEPRNEIERALTEVWQELFGIERVGVYDNFFDLGGHSLLAMRAAAQIQSTFQLEISLSHILEKPTIAALAELIEWMLIRKVAALSEGEVQQFTQNL
jgi:acyl transferase domain-containing protein